MLERKQLGHYRLIQPMSSGGVGETYLAEDMLIGRQVALKMVRAKAESYPDPNATVNKQQPFLREMQVITQLDHPRILPLHDFGEERDGNSILLYMVMPYCPQGSLADWLQRRGSAHRLSFQDVSYFIEQAAQALRHAHSHELVHQNVKASNFLIRDQPGYPLPDLLLSDFASARVMSATATANQGVYGTPTSMAPEQWQGHPEPATDQYALAIMAYSLLTGRPPFSGHIEQLQYQHLSIQPQPPGKLNPAISSDLDSVILTALNKAPSRRFGSVVAFARAFEQASTVSGFALPMLGNPATPIPPDEYPVVSSPSIGNPITPVPSVNELAVYSATEPAELYVPTSNSAPAALSSAYSVSQGSEPRLPAVPPVMAYPVAYGSPALPPTVPPNSPQPVVLPPVQEQPPAYPPYPEQSPANYQPPTEYPPYQGQSLPASPPYQGQAAPGYPYAQGSTTRKPRLLIAVIAGCVALALIVSGFIGINLYQGHVASVNAQATANAQATVNTQSTGVAQATQAVQATSTAVASQATASAQATANVQASATAQVVASNPYPSYMTGAGAPLVLFDPLQGPNYWHGSADASFGGICQFTNGAFHVAQSQPNRFYYCPSTPTFGDFALEVQMTIVHGDCGGVVIRATSDGKMYYFTICSNGSYSVWKFVDNNGSNSTELTSGGSGAISASGNNVVGILAAGSAMTLYINRQSVASIKDGSYTSGFIALTAQDTMNPTDVAYSNARVWA